MTKLIEGKYFLPNNKKLVTRAKERRKNSTPAGAKLWEYLHTFPYQ